MKGRKLAYAVEKEVYAVKQDGGRDGSIECGGSSGSGGRGKPNVSDL